MDQILTLFGSFPGSEGGLLNIRGKTADGATLGGMFHNLLNPDEGAKPGNEPWLYGGKGLSGGLKNDFLNRSESDELAADYIGSSDSAISGLLQGKPSEIASLLADPDIAGKDKKIAANSPPNSLQGTPAWDLSLGESQEEKVLETGGSEPHSQGHPGLYGFVLSADENEESKAGGMGKSSGKSKSRRIAPVPAEGADCVKEQDGAPGSAGAGGLSLQGSVNASGYGAGISSLEQVEFSAKSAEGEKGLPDQEKSVGGTPTLSQVGEEAARGRAFADARESGVEKAASGDTRTSPVSAEKSPILNGAQVQEEPAGTDARPQGVPGASSDTERGLTAFKGASKPFEGRQSAGGNVSFNPEEVKHKDADIAYKTKASLSGLGVSIKESPVKGVSSHFSPDAAGRSWANSPQSSEMAANKTAPVSRPSAGNMPSEGPSSSAGSGRGLLENELPVPAQGRTDGYSRMISGAQADIPRNEGIPEAPSAVGVKDAAAYFPSHEERSDTALRVYLQTNQGGEEQEKDRGENREVGFDGTEKCETEKPDDESGSAQRNDAQDNRTLNANIKTGIGNRPGRSHELKELKTDDRAIRTAETTEHDAGNWAGTKPGSKGDLSNQSTLFKPDLSGIDQISDKEVEVSDRTDLHVSGAETKRVSLTDSTGRMERLSGTDSRHSDGEGRAETSAINIQKISSAIRHARNNSGEIRIQLRPASLGHLQIKISAVEERSVSVRILAENPVSRELIERNIGELRSELRSNGIEMEKCEVLLTGDPARDGEGGRKFAAHEPYPGNHDTDKAEKDRTETGMKRRNYGGHNDGAGLSLFA